MENGNVEEVNEIRKKVRRTWWEDGLEEIVWGAVLLFVSFGWFVLEAKMLSSNIYRVVQFLWAIIVIGCCFVGYWIHRKLKAKYVWKKTGYSIPSYNKLARVLLVVTFLFGGFLVFSYFLFSSRISVLFLGLAVFMGSLVTFSSSGLKRFLVVGFFPLVIGIVGSIANLSLGTSLYLMVFVVGVVFLISGIRVYREFKKKVYNEG